MTDINGCNEIIEEGKNGRVIPPRNPEALFDMMDWFITHRDKVKQMANNAREMIVTRYNRQIIWNDILDIYNSLQ